MAEKKETPPDISVIVPIFKHSRSNKYEVKILRYLIQRLIGSIQVGLHVAVRAEVLTDSYTLNTNNNICSAIR